MLLKFLQGLELLVNGRYNNELCLYSESAMHLLTFVTFLKLPNSSHGDWQNISNRRGGQIIWCLRYQLKLIHKLTSIVYLGKIEFLVRSFLTRSAIEKIVVYETMS